MSAPREARKIQLVQIRSMQRLTTSIELTMTQQAVTNGVKLMEGAYQATTQVKVLSSEISNIVEVDGIHKAENRMRDDMLMSHSLLYRDLRPWHGMRWKIRERGRSSVFLRKYVGTSRKGRESTNDTEEVALTGSTLSLGKPSTWGSGQRWNDGLRCSQADTQRLAE